MMQRRALVVGIGSILGAPRWTSSQEPRSVETVRLGILGAGPKAQYFGNGLVSLLPGALHGLGWIEGRNITFAWRFADGWSDRLTPFAMDLVKSGVKAIVANATLEAHAAKRVTSTVPIVVYNGLDPVATGLVQSIARPGGNVTGMMWADKGLAAKMVDLILDAVPGARRLAILYDGTVPGQDAYADADADVARARGATVFRARVSTPQDVPHALTAIRNDRADALKVSGAGAVGAETSRILHFAASHRLPTIFAWPTG